MALPVNGYIQPTQIVDSVGHPARVTLLAGIYRLSVEAFISGGVAITADVENQKQGGDALLVMTAALPAAGATAVSAEISMVGLFNKKQACITVFADQPFEIYVQESISSGGTFRQSGIYGGGVVSQLTVFPFLHGKDFVKVAIKNIGAAAMTILEVTHKAWEF